MAFLIFGILLAEEYTDDEEQFGDDDDEEDVDMDENKD